MSVVHSSDRLSFEKNLTPICDQWVRVALLEPAERFLDRSGKQIRKNVVDLAFSMTGGTGEVPPCLGESIEWLHAGSLVIDDIQDESPMRRQQPALHVEIGIPLALNAGNWMYFQSLSKLFDHSFGLRNQHRLLRHLIQAGLRCHQGQALDLAANVDRIDPSHIETLVTETSRLKTGSLVAVAATFGAVAAGANKTLRNALSRFGMNVGVALQMRNDLQELRSLIQAASLGIELRTDDLRNARVTWPWAWAHQVCSADDFNKLLDQLRIVGDDNETVVSLASQLLNHTSSLGDKLIQDRMERQFRLLGEHVLDRHAMSLMRLALGRVYSNDLQSTEANHVDLA